MIKKSYKPLDSIRELIQVISTPLNIKHGRNRQIISFSQYRSATTVILHEGYAGMYRSSDHMLISNISAPIIMNINFLVNENPEIFLQARDNISYEEIEQDNLFDIVNSHNQWKNFALLSMYLSHGILNYSMNTSSKPTYELICNNLLELINEPASIRTTVNACSYIQDKTLISRSYVMKILTDLKKGGYIQIDKGILIAINYLPENY